MLNTVEDTIPMTQVIADNIADLVVLAGRLQPSIRAFVIKYGDIEEMKKVRNRMLYCREDTEALTNSLMVIADVLDENIAQLNELIS